jgi:Sister chromatid cohesion protein Dcc1
MELTRISVDQCRQYLMDEFELNVLDVDVLTKCLESVSDEQSAEDGTYTFNEAKLCRLLGERLLVAERGKQWQLDEFLDLWQKRTPHPFEAKLDMLRVKDLSYQSVNISQESFALSVFVCK